MILAALVLLAFADDSIRFDQPEIKLWPNGVPGSEGQTSPEKWSPSTDGFHRVTNIHDPSVTVFLPPAENATGAAFIVCPGGGHQYLVMDLEGSLVAKNLNEMGVAAFVLKSRLERAPGSNYKADTESLADARRAIRLVRSRAKEFGVNPEKVGIMGFSAGGELAALAETRFQPGDPNAADPVERQSSRPDFAVLGYPGFLHPQPYVPKETPPTFIVVANDDNLSTASAEFYTKLKAAGVKTELHIYLTAGHGFGMTGRTPAFAKLPVAHWPEVLKVWMIATGVWQ
ncbi:MAG TPA: alpha/beta hydrolase [Bryobacteraceae bacterium]|nr:alpha/beta hydrolase [Bryobacteraceae bacterium]